MIAGKPQLSSKARFLLLVGTFALVAALLAQRFAPLVSAGPVGGFLTGLALVCALGGLFALRPQSAQP